MEEPLLSPEPSPLFQPPRVSDASQYSPLPFGSPPSTASPGFAFPAPRTPLPSVQLVRGTSVSSLPRREWRGPLIACCGLCSKTDVESCCMATFLPCVAWAHNQQRAFDVNFVSQLIIYFFFVYVLRTAAISVLTTCQLADDLRDGASCHIANVFAGSVWAGVASSFALYAAWRRAALRRRFGIGGAGVCASVGDVAAWICCPACALCQETRTLAHNNVRQGFWLGPGLPGPGSAAVNGTEYLVVQPGVPILHHLPGNHAGVFNNEPASPVLGTGAGLYAPPFVIGQEVQYTAPSAVQTPVTDMKR